MPLTSGARIGAYEVIALLGAGGMGEVYHARDLHLDRDVAVKVLPDAFLSDLDRIARITREARVLASLNHPRIAALYGVEQSDERSGDSARRYALVMEFIAGTTLDERIRRGPIPIDEALAIAEQIAEALEAAHEGGVIHRDLKPANIKVRDDGSVKVLDFGLAKAMDSGALSSVDATRSPTITTPAMMTGVGVLLGTAAYMSPEQAKGRPADRRSDLWAFGCVLYEMLCGVRAFPGDELSETLASVIKGEPDWSRLPADTPSPIRRLLRRCLVKDPRQRVADASTARIEIQDAHREAAETPAPFVQTTHERVAWATVVALLAVTAGWLALDSRHSRAASTEMRVDIATPPTTDPRSFALSPDGRYLAFVATADAHPALWVRALDTTTSRMLPGTAGAAAPFWSADSRSLGFFADGRLKRIERDGTALQTLTTAPSPLGGTWNRDNVIVYAPSLNRPLFRISARGGESTPIIKAGADEPPFDRFPQFLPDGRRFLYRAVGPSGRRGMYIGQLDRTSGTFVTDADGAILVNDSFLLFTRQGELFAQAFDLSRGALTGDPQPIADGFPSVENVRAPISAAATGTIAFRVGRGRAQRQLVWFDRSGRELSRLTEPDATELSDPVLSPAGTQIVVMRNPTGPRGLWLIDLERGLLNNFMTPSAYPVWSPDGQHVAYSSSQGPTRLISKSLNGAEDQILSTIDGLAVPQDWSSDGRFLMVVRNAPPALSPRLWAVPLIGDRKPFPVTAGAAVETRGQFSPDSKWAAYESDDAGQREIYLQRFPSAGRKWRVSAAGGIQVRWRRDGKELFYIGLDRRMMAVPIRLDDVNEPAIGVPVALFATHVVGEVNDAFRQQYVVSADGQQFLINTTLEDPVQAPITLLLNWTPKH